MKNLEAETQGFCKGRIHIRHEMTVAPPINRFFFWKDPRSGSRPTKRNAGSELQQQPSLRHSLRDQSPGRAAHATVYLRSSCSVPPWERKPSALEERGDFRELLRRPIRKRANTAGLFSAFTITSSPFQSLSERRPQTMGLPSGPRCQSVSLVSIGIRWFMGHPATPPRMRNCDRSAQGTSTIKLQTLSRA